MNVWDNVSLSLRQAWANPAMTGVLVLEFALASVMGLLFLLADMALLIAINPAAQTASSFEALVLAVVNARSLSILLPVLIVQAMVAIALDSFFKAGLVGMAQGAVTSGKARIKEFFSLAIASFWNMFFAQLLCYGVVALFTVPLLVTGFMIATMPQPAVSQELWIGFFASLLLALLVWLAALFAFLYAQSALVASRLGAIEALARSARMVSSRFRPSFALAAVALLIVVCTSAIEWILGMPLARAAVDQPNLKIASDIFSLMLNIISIFGAIVITLMIMRAYLSAAKDQADAPVRAVGAKRAKSSKK